LPARAAGRGRPMPRGWPLCFALLFAAAPLFGAEPGEFKPRPFDWPQWRGPDRSGVCRETGLMQSWPAEGPPLAWKVRGLGGGYSTPSVAAGRIFGLGTRNDEEVVWALAEKDGKELWSTRV